MKKLIGSTARWSMFAALAVGVAACSEQADPLATGPDFLYVEDNTNLFCTTLYAGQTIDAGTVCASVNGTNLEITYTTTGGWELVEAHLWVGQTSEGYPQTNKGNPKVGNFPHHSGDITGQTTYTFSIALADLGISESSSCIESLLYAMAHAALRKDLGGGTYQTETGWGYGPPVVSKGNWATQFEFTVYTEGCNVGNSGTQTAFAYGGLLTSDVVGNYPDPLKNLSSASATCFLGISDDNLNWLGLNAAANLVFNRWGWTNGTISAGYSGSWNLYAGAADCDLEKGTLVGSVDVAYSNGTVTVTYHMSTPFTLNEAHVYVGGEQMPMGNAGKYTAAPGQYTVVDDVSPGGTYTITASGAVYVIVHAKVGGF